MGRAVRSVDIGEICRTIGFDVQIVDPFDLKGTEKILLEVLRAHKPRVLVFKRTCVLVALRESGKRYTLMRDPEKCIGEACGCDRYCTRVFKYPGLIWNPQTGKAQIDAVICTECGVCADICPEQAIQRERIS